jgi:hypothetical protein
MIQDIHDEAYKTPLKSLEDKRVAKSSEAK